MTTNEQEEILQAMSTAIEMELDGKECYIAASKSSNNEAARLAPSAINRQPWTFHMEPDSITVSVSSTGREFVLSKRLCCGIAMLQIEVAASNYGRQGHYYL